MDRKHYGRPSWSNWKRRQQYEQCKQRNYDKTFSDKPRIRAASFPDITPALGSPIQQAS